MSQPANQFYLPCGVLLFFVGLGAVLGWYAYPQLLAAVIGDSQAQLATVSVRQAILHHLATVLAFAGLALAISIVAMRYRAASPRKVLWPSIAVSGVVAAATVVAGLIFLQQRLSQIMQTPVPVFLSPAFVPAELVPVHHVIVSAMGLVLFFGMALTFLARLGR